MLWIVVGKYPEGFYSILRLFILIGVGFSAHWIITGTVFTLKGLLLS